MTIQPGERHIFWINKSDMCGIEVVNNTKDNAVDAVLEGNKLKVDSLSDTEFNHETIPGGFPIRIDKIILT